MLRMRNTYKHTHTHTHIRLLFPMETMVWHVCFPPSTKPAQQVAAIQSRAPRWSLFFHPGKLSNWWRWHTLETVDPCWLEGVKIYRKFPHRLLFFLLVFVFFFFSFSLEDIRKKITPVPEIVPAGRSSTLSAWSCVFVCLFPGSIARSYAFLFGGR